MKAGDLVQVIGAHCKPAEKFLGKLFVAAKVETGIGICIFCRGLASTVFAQDAADPLAYYAYVKRIPPLDELESMKHEKEITA
jgi:hypothetical protein